VSFQEFSRIDSLFCCLCYFSILGAGDGDGVTCVYFLFQKASWSNNYSFFMGRQLFIFVLGLSSRFSIVVNLPKRSQLNKNGDSD